MRLNQHQTLLGLASGGELGSRLAEKLGYQVSASTLIKRIRDFAPVAEQTTDEIKVLGVDDFALRRGCEYGTVLVDFERHKVIDLLPGREAAPLAEWLHQHPSVTTISRDRATAYQEGATSGAPQAEQIADRWHIFKNLTSAFEELLHRQASAIKAHWQTVFADELLPTAPPPPPEIEHVVPPTPSEYVRSQKDQIKRQQWHASRKARYEKVQELKAEGLNIAQVARYLGGSYEGTRLLYEASEYPIVQRQAPGSGVEQYDAYLRARWAEGCHNAQQLHRELVAQGYHRQPCQSLALCVSLAPGRWDYREWHPIITVPFQATETTGSDGTAECLALVENARQVDRARAARTRTASEDGSH